MIHRGLYAGAAAWRHPRSMNDQIVAFDLDFDAALRQSPRHKGQTVAFLNAQFAKPAHPGDAFCARGRDGKNRILVYHAWCTIRRNVDAGQIARRRNQIGDWLEAYAKVMELNYWGSTTATRARFDEATRSWEVTVQRDGKEVVLRPQQLVFALGVSGYPNVPKIPGADTFLGEQGAECSWFSDVDVTKVFAIYRPA